MKKKFSIFSSFSLKIIAIISMIIDHIGSIIFSFRGIIKPYLNEEGLFFITDNMPFLIRNAMQIKNICNIIGYIAFPIFAFLIVQGFLHTRSKEKYMLRLGIFALISEIPFDIAHFQTTMCFKLQNVMFTLLIGFVTIYFLEKIIENNRNTTFKKILFGILIFLLSATISFVFRSEFAFLGVATMVLMYLLRKNWKLQLLGIAPLIVVSPFVLLSLIPLVLYNGKKGKGFKYFFYLFYPIHFIVLVLISNYLTMILSK